MTTEKENPWLEQYDSADYKGTTGGLDVVMKNMVYDYESKDLSVKVKTAKYQKKAYGNEEICKYF